MSVSRIPLALLGSTGSIGQQTAAVLRQNPDAFSVVVLAAGKNIELLAEQVEEFHPRIVCVADDPSREAFAKSETGKKFRGQILSGTAGVCEAVIAPEVEAVVVGISGFAAFEPVLAALRAGKHLALANKECLVAGGAIFKEAIDASPALVVPVDSEHNSIYQCLSRRGCDEAVKRIILTASGGPFLETPLEELSRVTPEMAIRHPRWNMGKKISVDSATLMNKSLEVIEAGVLFGLAPSQIEVLIHPESVVHGLVEYEDGTMLAALYEPDMRVPITYALKVIAKELGGEGPGQSLRSGHSLLELGKRGSLRFLDPDPKRFPALGLAYRALREGGGVPAVLNAANEVAVDSFLAGVTGFADIVPVVTKALDAFRDGGEQSREILTISDINFVDSWGRKVASEYLAGPAPIAGDAGVSKRNETGRSERSGRAVCQ